jgi:hypothetical protein
MSSLSFANDSLLLVRVFLLSKCAITANMWPDLRTQICVRKSVYSMYLYTFLREKQTCSQIAYADLRTQICVRSAFYAYAADLWPVLRTQICVRKFV